MVSLRAVGWLTIFSRLLPYELSFSSESIFLLGLPGRALRFGLYVSTCCGTTFRVRVFLKYVLMDALSYSSAPGPSRYREDMPC